MEIRKKVFIFPVVSANMSMLYELYIYIYLHIILVRPTSCTPAVDGLFVCECVCVCVCVSLSVRGHDPILLGA